MQYTPPENPDALASDIEERHLFQPPAFILGGKNSEAG